MSVYDFWPLDGDPTQAEIAQEQQQRYEKEMESAKESRDRILKKIRERNVGV